MENWPGFYRLFTARRDLSIRAFHIRNFVHYSLFSNNRPLNKTLEGRRGRFARGGVAEKVQNLAEVLHEVDYLVGGMVAIDRKHAQAVVKIVQVAATRSAAVFRFSHRGIVGIANFASF